MKNSKGFTLVELLAAIVILGLLASVGVMSIHSVVEKSKENYYKSLKSNIEQAARDYYADHRILLPKERGEEHSVFVSASELEDYKYLKEVLDHTKKNCDSYESGVNVTRESIDNYIYEVHLSCPNVSDKYYK